MRGVVTAIGAGHWRFVAAGALGLLMVLGIKLRLRVFGTTDRGKAAAVIVLALLGVFSAALASSTPITAGLGWGSLGVAFTAVGARQWISRILWPADGATQWAEGLRPFLGR